MRLIRNPMALPSFEHPPFGVQGARVTVPTEALDAPWHVLPGYRHWKRKHIKELHACVDRYHQQRAYERDIFLLYTTTPLGYDFSDEGKPWLYMTMDGQYYNRFGKAVTQDAGATWELFATPIPTPERTPTQRVYRDANGFEIAEEEAAEQFQKDQEWLQKIVVDNLRKQW